MDEDQLISFLLETDVGPAADETSIGCGNSASDAEETRLGKHKKGRRRKRAKNRVVYDEDFTRDLAGLILDGHPGVPFLQQPTRDNGGGSEKSKGRNKGRKNGKKNIKPEKQKHAKQKKSSEASEDAVVQKPKAPRSSQNNQAEKRYNRKLARRKEPKQNTEKNTT